MKPARVLPLCFAALAAALVPAPAAGSRHNLTVSTEGNEIARCADIDIRFGDRANRQVTARAELALSATAAQLPVLRTQLVKSGGVSVRGESRADYAITVCKAAGGTSQAAAEGLLERIGASIREGRIVVEGPDSDDWVAYVLVEAPQKTSVELEAANGSIALRGLTGRIRVRTDNGPVELHDCAGDVEVNAQNGPIAYSGGGGRVLLRAENGPIAVDLGDAWEGERLEAKTENGPLALKVPARSSTGIRIESAQHAPWVCKADACKGARRTWNDDQRVVEFGGSPAVVRLATVNGPVAIEAPAYE